MAEFPTHDFYALIPLAVLVAGGTALLLSEVFLTSGRRGYQAVLTVLVATIAGIAAILIRPGAVFGGQASVDGFSAFVTVTVCAGLALSALVSAGWLHARGAERGEFYALAIFGAAGMVLLGMATDLLVAFVAIETMSLATYAMAAYLRRGRRPAEAAFKYLVLGAISSALFLYGSSLVYGATRSTLFSAMRHGGDQGLFLAGIALIASGLAFKVAAVPFHAWTPDVYEGAPSPVTAFMAAGVKTAAFAVLCRIFLSSTLGAGTGATGFWGVASALAILSMIFGNLLALPQRSVKRMLAYSSIAHAGYLLVGVVVSAVAGARQTALAAVLYYLATYTATVIGAFAVVGALERRGGPDDEPLDAWDLERFSGLARRRPALAFAMAVFLLSLAGIPPTAGFVGKLYIFKAAIGADLVPLALVGLVTSALGAYYYLRVIVYMYMRPAAGEEHAVASPGLSVALAAAVAVTILFGVVAQPLVELAEAASRVIL